MIIVLQYYVLASLSTADLSLNTFNITRLYKPLTPKES